MSDENKIQGLISIFYCEKDKDVENFLKDKSIIFEKLGKNTVAVKNALTEDILEEVYEVIGEGGKFKEILDISIGGQKDKSSEEKFAVAVAKAKYENKNLVYTITFTKQMKLAGLFYK